jgi:Fe-S cluster biogenesis protein NfuA
VLQERDEILPEAAPAAVKVVFVRDTGACEGCLLVRIKALEPRIDITTSELL